MPREAREGYGRGMSPRYALALLLVPLSLFGCRPQQAQLDEIQRKLDEVAAAQVQLSAKVDAGASAGDGATSGSANEFARMHRWQMEVLEQLERLAIQLDELEEAVETQPTVAAPAVAARPRPGRPDPKARYRIDIGKSHVRGSANALITIVEITDYQCPFCKRVQPTLDAVRAKYKRDVRLVHKHNPLPMHNRALPAAIAAEAAGRQGKFWEMHDLLWSDIRMLTDERFEEYAAELGLNLRRFKRDLNDDGLAKRIKAEQAQGVKVGARGTPAFFINGRFLSGAQPQEAFERVIDEELKAAKALVKRGTKKSQVYKTLMKDAKKKV